MHLQTQLAWSNFGTFLQLRSLDKGLRESVNVQKEQLKAHAEIVRVNGEILSATQQLAELTKEATALQRQQLQAQVQQLQLQQQRNEVELRKEERLAQENSILKLYVDLYSKAQSLKQQGLYFDCVILTLGAFRVYQQVYSDLDDANNRLKVTELKDRMYTDMREAVNKEEAQHALAAAYAEVLREPAALAVELASLEGSVTQIRNRLAVIRSLTASDALPHSPAMIAELGELKLSNAGLLRRFEVVTSEVPADELFMPSTPERLGGALAGFGASWNAWCDRAAETHSTNLVDLRTRFMALPTTVEATSRQLESLSGELTLVCEVFGLIADAEAFGSSLPELQSAAADLRARLTSVPPQPTADPVAVGAASILLAEIQQEADDRFSVLRATLAKNKHANSPKFASAVARRAADSRVAASGNLRFIREAFELEAAVATLMADVGSTGKRYQKAVANAAAGQETFNALEGELRRSLTEEQLARVDTRVAEYRPGCIGRLMSLFRGQSGKEADNRRVIAEAIIAERGAAARRGPGVEPAYARVSLPRLMA